MHYFYKKWFCKDQERGFENEGFVKLCKQYICSIKKEGRYKRKGEEMHTSLFFRALIEISPHHTYIFIHLTPHLGDIHYQDVMYFSLSYSKPNQSIFSFAVFVFFCFFCFLLFCFGYHVGANGHQPNSLKRKTITTKILNLNKN